MEMTLIETAVALQDFCDDELATAQEVAVDTESDQFHAYRPTTCLIQLATRDACALVDPLALTKDELEPLWRVFADTKIEKILHSAANDLNVIERDFDVRFENVFDTQVAARFLRYERDGLAFLLDLFFGLKASKQYQKFDWKIRPLPEEPKRYAAEDVIYLHAIRDRMKQQLLDDGWWEPFTQTCTHLAKNTRYSANPFNEDGWRKLKYPKGFTAKQRSVLKAVYLWRHRLCLDLNMAPFHVLPNHTVIRIASTQPRDEWEFRREVGRIRSVVEPYIDGLLDAVKDGLAADPPPARPPRIRSNVPRPTVEEEACYEALRGWRNQVAEVEDLPFELIANNATLREIARQHPQSGEALVSDCGLLPWQVRDFGADILKILGAR